MHELLPMLTSPNQTVARTDFWIAGAVLFVVGLVLSIIPLLGMIVPLVLLYPWTCLAMGRLRDMDRTPWIAFGPAALCALCGGLGFATAVSAMTPAGLALAIVLGGATLTVATLALPLTLGFLLWIGLTDGEEPARLSAPTRR
ncbi:hypothetical protein [Sphingomonas sp. NIBR02145]|uniref:hypothetical protein n=1 Tax=Sphingomonas sp. NIBR02145 TaxID=3014784 RepID=UPI0022B30A16|nr:hypothetical protein [Sphingomonas sp. NIBR02145]WHU04330.1 hypothetical protein O3305_07000 [Sphingomonas sp. NIBR02145]